MRNLGFFSSDHAPLLLESNKLERITRSRRFRYENAWIREVDCKEVVRTAWLGNTDSDIFTKMTKCATELTA